MRQFETGATRSSLKGKPQYEGYLSPLVLRRYGEYMLKHQTQEDGKQRAADNWQKGLGLDSLMDSLIRHLIDVWLIHRGHAIVGREDESMEELLCAVMFNTMGYLFELLKGAEKTKSTQPFVPALPALKRKGCAPGSTFWKICKWGGTDYVDEASSCSICRNGDRRIIEGPAYKQQENKNV